MLRDIGHRVDCFCEENKKYIDWTEAVVMLYPASEYKTQDMQKQAVNFYLYRTMEELQTVLATY